MKYIIHCGPGIGDFVIILPMAKLIKLNDPDASISLFMRSDKQRIKNINEMLPYQDYIDNVYYYSKQEPFHNFSFLCQIGLKSYDYGFNTSYVDTPYVSDWPYRILKFSSKQTVGFDLHYRPNYKYEKSIPFSAANSVYKSTVGLLKPLGLDFYNEREMSLSLLNKNKILSHVSGFCRSKDMSKMVALVVGTANAPVTADGTKGNKPAKSWPYKYWDMLSGLFVEAGYRVTIIGGEKEQAEIQGNSELFKRKDIFNFCGRLSIIDSIGILCQSRLVIGADTGLMHCAGAVGVPSLTLYGCTDYKNYLFPSSKAFYIAASKSCSPCFGTKRLLTCNKFECMSEILPDAVFVKAKSILEEELHEN